MNEKMNIHDRDEVEEAFGEDITLIRKGNARAGSQFSDEDHKLVPRPESMPSTANTEERIMRVALGMGKRVYDNPLQLAISLKGFETWCEQSGWTPNYATIAYYLGISKGTLVQYTNDRTEYTCYSIVDNITREYIYSTNSKKNLQLYIERNNIVDIDEDTGEVLENKERDIVSGNCKSIQQKIDDGEFSIVTSATTFADILEPVNNLIEMLTLYKGEVAKNPALSIFMLKNRCGRTTQYTDRQEIAVQASNPIDDMSDDEILKAAQAIPEDE